MLDNQLWYSVKLKATGMVRAESIDDVIIKIEKYLEDHSNKDIKFTIEHSVSTGSPYRKREHRTENYQEGEKTVYVPGTHVGTGYNSSKSEADAYTAESVAFLFNEPRTAKEARAALENKYLYFRDKDIKVANGLEYFNSHPEKYKDPDEYAEECRTRDVLQ